ncbi:MAG: hypothetical protein P4L71_20105 [Acetobacteraceae bacterium]|nr:hypothetical protein [Acetobacteraceae bacterium]
MSGTILGAIGSAEAVGSILSGDSGPVVLGSVVFTGMEVPASMPWGGQQQIVVHKFPGGARVIDAMGRDDMPLTWSGILDSYDRAERAYTIDQMRVAGLPVKLTWGTHVYTVVIREFRCEDVAFMGRYSITCEVVRDESTNPATQSKSILAEIEDGISQALAVAEVVVDAVELGTAIVTDLTASQTTIQPITSVAAGDDNSDTIQTAVVTVQTDCTTVQTAAETAITTIAAEVTTGDPSAILLGAADASTATTNLTTALDQSAAQAAAMVVQGYMGRIVDNLTTTDGATTATATFDTPSPPAIATGGGLGVILTASGGTLYALAAKQLGDATQWYRIAQANSLSDPMLSGIQTLKIPDAIAATSDGIPSGSNTVI